MKMFDKEDILVKLCLTHEKQKIESEKKNTYWHYHFTEKGFAKNLDPIFLFFKLSPVKIFFTTAKY